MIRLDKARGAALAAALGLLQACGGGGGDDDVLLPTLSQDVEPSGARIDVSAQNYFPLSSGNSWTYDRKTNGFVDGTVTRTVLNGPDADGRLTIREVENGLTDTSAYVLNAAGLAAQDPLGAQGVYPGVFEMLPSYLEYATPFFPAGSTRQTIRQGSLKADIDGDGKSDYFRVEFTQLFVGFETLSVFGQDTEVAHFRTTLSFTIVVTSNRAAATAIGVEDTYLAPDFGLVRADRSVMLSDGTEVVAPYTIELREANLGGQAFP